MRVGRRLSTALLLALLAWPAVAAAQIETHCPPGQVPTFVFGFADLRAYIGEDMGEPLTCEFADPHGTGDVHQVTTMGLAFWRKSTNTPTFTNGWEHWGRTEAGWVCWLGENIDPAPDAWPCDAPVAVPAPPAEIGDGPTPPVVAPGRLEATIVGAAPGGTAYVTARTSPGGTCTLSYTTPSGTRSQAAGLGATTADAEGVAAWSWVISPNTNPGEGTVTVTCGDLQVTSEIPIG